jgi:hypothetical protein
MVGDVFFFPIKLIAALSISIFIYVYLVVFWVYYTQGIKKIIEGIRDIMQVIAMRFNKNGLELTLKYFTAAYNAFICTIAFESFIILVYSVFLLNAF